ncbi:MAG: alpha-L-fucosidase [Acidimicrobiia bacterium]|nr:alpha-L-fucosidase [Acidimicrobiia bacterium]
MASVDPTDPEPPADSERCWFDEARLGMFVHWDHASQRGLEVSWPLVGGVFSLPRCQSVTPAEYHALAETFCPDAWDAEDLARRAAAAGMRYVVFTTRHHSGYAMFATDTTDHGVMNGPFGRDIVAEVVEAFRAEGLRIGLYYSLSDWHHPDYPAFTEEHLPYLLGLSPPLPTEEQADRYRAYLMAQLRELLTNYGPIDVLWFDGQWERHPDWWRVDDIAALARELQPDILVNDRLPGHGDFLTPEQFVPPTSPGPRWESCVTMNDSWGWNPDDGDYKSAHALLCALCETAGRGGNLLLNVSPRCDGTLPPEQIERLDAISNWMDDHAEAIGGTGAGLDPWQYYGPSTRRTYADGTERLYLFVLARPHESITVRGIPVRRVRSAHLLGADRPLEFATRTGVLEQLLWDPDGEVTVTVPTDALDPLVSVVTLDLATEPDESRSPVDRVRPGDRADG